VQTDIFYWHLCIQMLNVSICHITDGNVKIAYLTTILAFCQASSFVLKKPPATVAQAAFLLKIKFLLLLSF
ncbi:MAG TPA: hypothetical protein PL159_02430, partial [Candidatus Paceibacterota bacterium]|nr:hypothetical protein [Candidatus Paceibacterota bacterium]